MKKHNKAILLFLCAVLIFVAEAGDRPHTVWSNSKTNSKVVKKITTYSNLNSKKSVKEVKTLLSASLDKDSVTDFMKQLNDYNKTVGAAGLKGNFTKFKSPRYDVDKIGKLWRKKKGDFIGTNCRINSYILLKRNIEVPKGDIDDSLLFLDNDAINKGKIFDERDKEKFRTLFSRVKTEATKDIGIHAKNMEKHFANIKFNKRARMISVIIHDNLDGDYLFVGHVGVLVPKKDGFLFVEKLSFEEPYQAIKFSTKNKCYKYLKKKYADYTGEGLAKPFIMDNGKRVAVR